MWMSLEPPNATADGLMSVICPVTRPHISLNIDETKRLTVEEGRRESGFSMQLPEDCTVIKSLPG